MELIVDEEIDQQTRALPAITAHSINRIEVAACALNQLPPLYASSQEGVSMQYDRALHCFHEQISAAVSKAINAVQSLPSKGLTPFTCEQVTQG
ncbi:MAG: late competence development ComFB family protein [Acaryochloridaceae cyanobacterium SU_2_1]|nr:late competence development ComFB family protein [Acaryochloridaceae cyanobacterium SU_2_1]NJM95035.1 late competence development ComFB family protein [Acaryochloridaceae cyanobacterium CSU_5_19]